MRRLLNDLLARFRTKPTPTRSPAGVDVDLAGVQVEYDPHLDGDPDPGEVVWTWVPYEDDPSQGKDRPVVVIGRQGAHLVGVPLTSKQHDNEPQVSVGTGPWDRNGRESFAKLERLLCIDADQVRREGAVLDRDRFDAVVAGVQRVRRRR
jgi:PemK-like, MazF-like toxin of type II toxin-antitoxin system